MTREKIPGRRWSICRTILFLDLGLAASKLSRSRLRCADARSAISGADLRRQTTAGLTTAHWRPDRCWLHSAHRGGEIRASDTCLRRPSRSETSETHRHAAGNRTAPPRGRRPRAASTGSPRACARPPS
eukprot:scaffold2429_cov263-Pinguiococcus_pyrenoidosus.AAC.4